MLWRAVIAACALPLTLVGCTSSSPSGEPTSPQHRVRTVTSSARATERSVTAAVRETPGPSTTQTTSTVPPLTDAQRAAHLRDIRSIVPNAIVDLRYATPHNFVGVRLYPRDARCLVHRSMTRGLSIAARRLRQRGLVLVFWDCYRPHHVQVTMYRHTPNPAWVAKPHNYATSHEAARSADVTLARRNIAADCPRTRRVQGHCRLRMGTKFDSFTPRAYAYATSGVSRRAQHNRAVLRRAMAAGGIAVYSGEWWHFDGPGALVPRPLLAGVTVD